MKSITRVLYSVLLLGLLSASAWATDPSDNGAYPPDTSTTYPSQPEANNAQDPPGRVARIDYMSGQVSIQPHGTDDWVQAERNRPLTLSDNVWADKDSRGELDLGTGFMRINSETSLTLTNVNNDAVQVSLHQGALNVHIQKLYGGEVWEVDTPNMAFTISKSGEYRFDVDPNSDTTMVTVWKGEGQATGQGPAVRLHEGEQAQFNNGTSLTHETHSAPRPDGFDEWCQVRDRQLERSVSARHVAPGTVGYEDLDEYGTWKESPEYGDVWVPTAVSPGWAPYSYGNWMWQDPWGWTWVDSYPWGFAPFHYGRWVSWGGGWGWAPGPYWVRPWYAPALVAWWGGPRWGLGFGWGWGFGVGFGFGGGFGWCPLGFHDAFFPWYHVSAGYFRGVNFGGRIANFNHISNTYFHDGGRNALYGRAGVRMPEFANRSGAVTAMSREGLEHGLQVRGNSVRPTSAQLQTASSLGRVNASPTRASVLGARSGQAAARPSSAAFSRSTVTRMNPPAAPRSAATQAAFSRGAENNPTRSAAPTAARTPENAGRTNTGSAAVRSPAPGGRYVPRPPQSMRSSNMGSRNVAGMNQPRTEPSQTAMNHNVPRPPANARIGSASSERSGSFNSSSRSGEVPHPTTSARNTNPSMGSYGSSRSVPRPSAPVTRSYSEPSSGYSSRGNGGYSGAYSSRSYGGGYGSYGSSRSGTYGRSGGYSAPSHSSGGYSSARGGSFGGSRGGGGFHSSGGASHSSGGGSHGGGHH